MTRVIADTSVWSHLLRRRKAGAPVPPSVDVLRRLIEARRVQMLGVIRQELLSGLKHSEQFERLRRELAHFPDLPATTADHILAARFFNTCRERGVSGSFVDFLICAQAVNAKLPILADDGDFVHYAKHIPIRIARI